MLQTTRRQVGNKSEQRSFNPQWYKEFPWIHLCVSCKKVFCFHCLKCYETGLITYTKRYETAFIVNGFQNWKKAVERFNRHSISECHREAISKVRSLTGASIVDQLSSEASKSRCKNRRMFIKVLSSLQYLLRQGLAIRGHKDEESNLYQLLKLRCEDCPELSGWLKKHQYMSHDIINELITLMGKAILRDLLVNIREANWFAILADETRDVSNHEQLSLSIRWVDKSYLIHEDFIGLVHVLQTTADSLTAAIKDVLIRCILPLSNCRGQAYDGASNMMGHLRGVATQIMTSEPTAIKVHCFAHCLNLCLQDVTRNCQPIKAALDLTTEISQLIMRSPKRSLVFDQCKNDLSPQHTGLRPLCPTRWTVRTCAIDAILKNYSALLEALEIINAESHDDYGRRAGGVLSLLQRFETFFGLNLSHLIFSATEQTSRALQAQDTSVQEALSAVNLAAVFIKRQRKDSAYQLFYSSVVLKAKNYTDDPVLPRYRRPPRCLDDGSAPHSFASPEDYYRTKYFEALDFVENEINRRFDQGSLALPDAIETFLIRCANTTSCDESCEVPDAIVKMYSKDIKISKLRQQAQMLPDLVATYKTSQGLSKFQVTKVRTISEMLLNVPSAKALFSEIDRLLRIYFTIPISTATAERSFSSLRRIKTFLRSTMTEARLNNVLLLHAHKDNTDQLDLCNIAETFASLNSQRRGFFGTFTS